MSNDIEHRAFWDIGLYEKCKIRESFMGLSYRIPIHHPVFLIGFDMYNKTSGFKSLIDVKVYTQNLKLK